VVIGKEGKWARPNLIFWVFFFFFFFEILDILGMSMMSCPHIVNFIFRNSTHVFTFISLCAYVFDLTVKIIIKF
jgi:hypothetical protein